VKKDFKEEAYKIKSSSMAGCRDLDIKNTLFILSVLGDKKARNKVNNAILFDQKCECVKPYFTSKGKLIRSSFRCRRPSNR